ncbi:Helix-turn-helix domain-containing protein [Fictibacillus enclensis]|uniref:HTH cro/C1-type domain-containing protein n=1 Tax=Fictibacillus enclensis TaxID=1017270 RepID=A0A0V8IUX1_9BACL|nr:helix-turn-helix domain-containing protein [Fictibacillus enclensis]KSU78472.1 hypothetical protein AS030_21845 [Fictibacillus enclensis]SCC40878.1 Helix-turn-helix domain-containing protein [Fictibacillus enclensis]
MFGERIRLLRKEKGMTLRELANELDIPFTTLGNYEREDRQPNFEMFEAIADYFNVSIDFLTGRHDQRTFDEIVFNNDFKKLQVLLAKADPGIREQVVNIFDQVYLITNESMESELDITKELKIIFEIVNFIFRMKNGFVWSKSDYGFFKASNSYEFAVQYLKEKRILDKEFNDLLEIYSKRFK